MKLKISAFLILFFIITVIPLRAELVFLNDGSIIEGEIITNTRESITVKDNEARLYKIQRDNILKTRPSIKPGKVYIQKRNGDGISAYIVEEDKTFYTLRKELDNPNEFIINKSDVIFISKLAPSNVTGFLGANQINLTWTKPQNAVKHYKVYYSTGKNEKYKLDGITSENSYTLRNIYGDKTYYIIVTSVGIDNSESPPSNELRIKTEINPPSAQQKDLDEKESQPAADLNLTLLVKPLYVYPIGDLREVFDHGYGGSLGFAFYKFHSSSVMLSFETGYIRWIKDEKKLNSDIYMIPNTFSFGAKLNFSENLSLSILAGGGVIFISKNCYLLVMEEEKNRPTELMLTGSMNFDYTISKSFSFFIGGGFSTIYKSNAADRKNKYKNYADGHIGISCRLK
jgi:hypothetical protein